ncbi:MAG: hypothetical protein PWP54_576 [Thermosipho sp. (in: thermotogales)]|nr:hypothetical protein [Thermosipho sp. (in: thermotogales)]
MGEKNIWKLLWTYDPNGLVVVNNQMKIILVNPAFCRMFKVSKEIQGHNLEEIIGHNISCFKRVFSTGENIVGKQIRFSERDLIALKVVFKIPEEGLVAGIFTDITHKEKQKEEKEKIKEETIEKVHQVIDQQMETAQKIASLLGETTAKTKAYLLKVLEVIREGR